MRILLINNLPRYSGIGQYGFCLYCALRDVVRENVRLLDWHSDTLDRLFYKSLGTLFPFFIEETVRFLALTRSSLAVPRDYNIYHFLNPVLYGFNHNLHPAVVTIHDMVPMRQRRGFSDFVSSGLLRSVARAEAIICDSSFSARLLLSSLRVSPNRVRIVPLGVDHGRFRPRDKERARDTLGLPRDAKIILHVGSDEPRKNIPGLLRIFEAVRQKVPRTILIRLGPIDTRIIDRDPRMSTVIVKPRESRVHYYYNAADLLLFPSLVEGFGLPPLEAMASGTPVVATSLPSIVELVGNAALAYHPADINGLTDATIRVLTDPKMHDELVHRGISRSERFSWLKCAEETLRVYRSVLRHYF